MLTNAEATWLPPSDPCLTAVTQVGAVRRLQALAADGVRWGEIASAVGVSQSVVRDIATGRRTPSDRIREATASAYPGLAGWRRVPELQICQRRWADSSQWQDRDIDDPATQPAPLDATPDEVVVERVLAGVMAFNALRYRCDRAEAVRLLAGEGLRPAAVASRLRCSTEAVRDLLQPEPPGEVLERFGPAIPVWEPQEAPTPAPPRLVRVVESAEVCAARVMALVNTSELVAA